MLTGHCAQLPVFIAAGHRFLAGTTIDHVVVACFVLRCVRMLRVLSLYREKKKKLIIFG